MGSDTEGMGATTPSSRWSKKQGGAPPLLETTTTTNRLRRRQITKFGTKLLLTCIGTKGLMS